MKRRPFSQMRFCQQHVNALVAVNQLGHAEIARERAEHIGLIARQIGSRANMLDHFAYGLFGSVIEILVEADGVAEVECRNFGGNVAPGQDTSVEVAGTTGPLPTPKNGNYVFEVETVVPSVPNTPTCSRTPEVRRMRAFISRC